MANIKKYKSLMHKMIWAWHNWAKDGPNMDIAAKRAQVAGARDIIL